MVFLFYISGIVAILSTVCAILHYHPMHALLCLIVSFLSVSCVFFALGAVFAGAVEIIVYAGAIMILFIFVIMMLNTEDIISGINQECKFLHFKSCFGAVLSSGILCVIVLYIVILETKNNFIYVATSMIDLHQIGYKLFGFYILVVEIASFLLLSALVTVLHISQEYKKITNISSDKLKM